MRGRLFDQQNYLSLEEKAGPEYIELIRIAEKYRDVIQATDVNQFIEDVKNPQMYAEACEIFLRKLQDVSIPRHLSAWEDVIESGPGSLRGGPNADLAACMAFGCVVGALGGVGLMAATFIGGALIHGASASISAVTQMEPPVVGLCALGGAYYGANETINSNFFENIANYQRQQELNADRENFRVISNQHAPRRQRMA